MGEDSIEPVQPPESATELASDTEFSCRRGVVVSGVCLMNEVTLRPVSTGMWDRLRAGISSRFLTSQLAQLSMASLRVR